MPSASKSFKHNVWQLVFAPAIAIALLLSISLVSFCLYELAKFVDMRGTAMTRKTAQLIYTPILNHDTALLQAILDGSLEDPYIRAVHVQLDAPNAGNSIGTSFHSGPDFLPMTDKGESPNSYTPVRRETHRTILFSHPITNKDGSHALGWVEVEMLSSPYMVIHYQTILITIAITLGCLCIAAFLATRLFRNITEPLNHIKEVINHLAQGKLQTRVNPQKSREFIYLANATNTMAESLENAQQDLQHTIEQSTQDLTETLETIEIKNIELDIARKEAIEASRIKSEFLANTSHEIRTPLNGILGFATLALKTELDEQQAEYLHTIRDSAHNLLTVINGILDFSKIEAGKLTLDYAPLPLRQTIDDTLQTLAPDAHEKNLQLTAHVDAEIPPQLLGDSLRFKQVLANLISNAIKFSEQGNIVVRVAALSQQETQLILKVSVSDQGKGLSETEQKDLFKPFSQSDASSSREQGGTGLGLAICKGLVERMHGEIGVDSEANKGSTFWFTARLGIDKKHLMQHTQPTLANYRALICSNNPAVLEQLQTLLSEWHMQHHAITEIHDIFSHIRRTHKTHPIDIVLLDIAANERKIPPALLNNITEQLREEFGCKVIACCTAAHQRLLRSNGNNINTHFINKPIGYDALLKGLCEQLKLINSPQELPAQETQSMPATSVLLVDDNPANLQLASELLRGLNTQVVQASNGLQAIDACKTQHFDVIFMDIQMPGMDGFQTTQHIRKLEDKTTRTPIIALTAHSLTEQKTELLIAGMDDCISKPVSEAQLAHIINRWASLSGKKEVVIPREAANKQAKLPLRNAKQESNSSVDINLCLKLANHKPLLARDMLKMMLDGLVCEKAQINQAVTDDNNELLSELIHRLYGSCCYCGVPRLKSISGLLDKLIQAKKIDQAKDAIPSLNSAIEDVLAWGEKRDLNAIFGVS